MKKLFFVLLVLSTFVAKAQTAKVYRGGTLLGTYTNLTTASNIASVLGDSILLSAHTFKEYNIPMKGGQIWQGTITAIDTTIIDAENKGQIGRDSSLAKKNRALTIRDIICINGYDTSMASGTGGGAFYTFKDSLALRGQTIIRNCYAKKTAGGVYLAYAFDKVKISHNHSDSFGGAAAIIFAFDSVEISYNTALYGGAVGNSIAFGGGSLGSYSSGVVISNNSALISGGAVYGRAGIHQGQLIYNQAPIGPGVFAFTDLSSYPSCVLGNTKVYNPDKFGMRQVEVFVEKSGLVLNGAWFGKSDTIGLLRIKPSSSATISGKYAIANWSVNRGVPLSKADTLFPIGAAFTY
ncbi:MAG: hypothetical protein IT256_02935, partial [Chitinophagaceae bacterium]|nr:hypothetical protein [Chitinophagaceae bacterium]